MNKVRISKERLLTVTKRNRDEHIKTYEEALEGYKEELVKALEEILRLAKSGEAYYTEVDIQKPVSYQHEYDSVIKMLEMSEDSTVELSQDEFRKYVEDKWNWQGSFLESNSRWSKSAREKAPVYTMGSSLPKVYMSR